MGISRRSFLHKMTAGTALSTTTWHLAELSLAASQNASNSPRPGDPIRLDMNINPYGPSPKVVEVIRANLGLINRYPDDDYAPLLERIAEFHKVKSNEITLGCGSCEVLRMAITTFLGKDRALILASPGFEPVANLAKQAGAEVIAIPINKRYAHDLDAMLHRTSASTGLIYVCNPHNPTGSLTPRKDIETFLEKLSPNVVVVIDEAYNEYAEPTSDYASFIDHPVDDKRVIVVRTFSKIYGLAGLRLGYSFSSKEVCRKLSSTQLKRGVNGVVARCAVAALDDSDYIRLSFDRNKDERQAFYNQTNARMLRQIDSLTNFVFTKTALPASQVVEHFERNHITLGPVFPEMDRYVRVAISTVENMKEFWRIWDLLPMSHKMASNRLVESPSIRSEESS
jgi:histidinol-phosphate aminotransferase